MIRYVHLQLRRLATALAIVATLAFVLDGALGADHHLPASSGGVHTHAHAHGHASADASDQHVIGGHLAGGVDLAAAHQDFVPQSGPDANVNCCFCACSAAVVLPSLTVQPVSFVLARDATMADRRAGDGIVPEGLRRPPRPLAIA